MSTKAPKPETNIKRIIRADAAPAQCHCGESLQFRAILKSGGHIDYMCGGCDRV